MYYFTGYPTTVDGKSWATATKNVKKPLGKKLKNFYKMKMLHGPKVTF